MKYKLLLVDAIDDVMGIAASGEKYDKLRPDETGDEIYNPHAYDEAACDAVDAEKLESQELTPCPRNEKPSMTLVFENLSLEASSWPKVNSKSPKKNSLQQKLDSRYILDVDTADYRLNTVSGFVRTGEILAIMGSSGAGKTTLLDIISGTETHNSYFFKVLEGDLFISQENTSGTSRRPHIGYVTQDSIFLATQTVRETLWTHAQLRLPKSAKMQDKKRRVTEVLGQMGLSHVADIRVGDQATRGISGGEKKRLQIAVELLQKPDLLFLDEPTTGLDAHSAEKVISHMRKVADQGCAVVCTIHQPRYSIFYKLDNLLLLSRGMPMYFGPATKALEYFKDFGYEFPVLVNPADILIDLITPGHKAHHKHPFISSADDVPIKAQKFYKSSYGEALQENINKAKAIHLPKIFPSRKETGSSSVCQQFSALFQRQLRHYAREPRVLVARLVEAMAVGLLTGSIFWKTNNEILHDTLGALFFCTIWVAISAFGNVSAFIRERLLANSEFSIGLYSLEAYYLVQMFINTIVVLLFDSIYSVITYFTINLHGYSNYFLILFLVHLTAESSVIFGSVLCGTAEEAFFLGGVLVMFPILFCGFYRQLSKLPVFWKWAQYVSWGKYAMTLALRNQLSEQTKQIVNNATKETKEMMIEKDLGYDSFGLTTEQQYCILIGFAVAWRIMPYVALKLKSLRTGKL